MTFINHFYLSLNENTNILFYLQLKRKSYCYEISIADCFEDLVNGAVWGQGAVEDVEMPLESGRDVVTPSTRVNHGCNHLNVHNVGELSGLLQVVETSGLHHLSSDLIGHLQKSMFKPSDLFGHL